MKLTGCLIILAAVAASTLDCIADGRSAGIGGRFAYDEISLVFQYEPTEKYFLEISANLDMNGVISGKNLYPGASAGFIYGIVFAEKKYPDGESISGFAGPGLKAGYVRNGNGRYGFMGGLMGTVGFKYSFNVPVSLSLSLNPLLSVHMSRRKNGTLRLDMHKYGIVTSLMPRLSIIYEF